jgi:hypothetical protein
MTGFFQGKSRQIQAVDSAQAGCNDSIFAALTGARLSQSGHLMVLLEPNIGRVSRAYEVPRVGIRQAKLHG